MLERLDIELSVLVAELHQVQRGEVAGAVVEEHILRAGVAGVDAVRVLAGVPLVDGGVVLHAGVAADPGALADHLHQVARLVGRRRLSCWSRSGCSTRRRARTASHELVGDAHGVVGVLEVDAVVGAAGHVERAAVAGVDQRPGLLLLFRLAGDEVGDIRVVDVEHHHLGGAAGLAAALDGAGELVEAAHKGERAADAVPPPCSALVGAAHGWRGWCRCRCRT